MKIRHAVPFLALVVLVTLAASGASAVPATLDSGVRGLVTINGCGPVTPQSKPKPFDAHIRILDEGTGRVLRDVTSGSDGTYRIALRPGRYIVKAGPPTARSIAYSKLHKAVLVSSHEFARVDVRYDNGCR